MLEPDPIASVLLGRRLRRLGIDFRLERADHLIAPLLRGRPGLVELLRADPTACLIFGNVLGQTRFLMDDSDFAHFKSAFREQLGPLLIERAWLSFHDRLSGNFAPHFRQPYTAEARLEDAAVLQKLYPPTPGQPVQELFDHESEGFFPTDLPHSYFHWSIGGSRHHLVEGVMSVPSRTPATTAEPGA